MSDRIASPVDYKAWERGYMPPPEHVLIDALAYRGAKVVYSSQGGLVSVWFVIAQQGTLDRRKVSAACKHLMQIAEDLESCVEPEAPSITQATAEMPGITPIPTQKAGQEM